MEKCIFCNTKTNGTVGSIPICEDCYKTKNQDLLNERIKELNLCTTCGGTGIMVSWIGGMKVANPCVMCKNKEKE